MLVTGLSPYDVLDCRVHFALLQSVERERMPPRRSYLWRLLRRCWGQRVAIVNVTLAGVEEIRTDDVVGDVLNFCRFEAATIIAAHVYTSSRKTTAANDAFPVQDRAELAGTVYGADTITELVRLATPLAAGEFVWLGFELPEGWYVPHQRLPRS